jgi:shikimate kinase
MTQAIYLVGFMGSGKTTVGRELATRLGVPFLDLDDDIEALRRKPISRIFDEDGEASFRDAEHEALAARAAQAANGESFVLALGGGAFTFPRNREVLDGRGLTVWLDCSFETALRRVRGFEHRPLARDPEKFRILFESRRAAYSHASLHIPIQSDEPRDAVQSILEALS